MFAIAQPDAVVISVFKLHAIPDGEALFVLSAKIEYAPTLQPTEYGKIKMLSFRVFPNNSWFLSVIFPVLLSTEDRKLIGCVVNKINPFTVPPTIVLPLSE
jgi:hypothetical protein